MTPTFDIDFPTNPGKEFNEFVERHGGRIELVQSSRVQVPSDIHLMWPALQALLRLEEQTKADCHTVDEIVAEVEQHGPGREPLTQDACSYKRSGQSRTELSLRVERALSNLGTQKQKDKPFRPLGLVEAPEHGFWRLSCTGAAIAETPHGEKIVTDAYRELQRDRAEASK